MELFKSLSGILSVILANPKTIESTVNAIVNMFKATTATTPTTVPASPTTAAVEKAPSDVVKELQALLNKVVKPQPPLAEDGWMGEKTEAAIKQALVMAKPYLSMLG